MITIGNVLAYIVIWGSMTTPMSKGFEDRQLAAACMEAQAHEKERGGVSVLKISVYPSMSTYAVMCNTPRCSTPPARIEVESIKCTYIPETKKVQESIMPGHWEAQ